MIIIKALLGLALPIFASVSLPSMSNYSFNRGVDCDRVRNNDLICLACNIYHESGNQSFLGKIAVGAVTINRVMSSRFPDSICGVVWEHGEFSWTEDGKSDRTRYKNEWLQSMDIAYGFLLKTNRPHGAYTDPTDCALFYHATYIRTPYWVKADNMIQSAKIGRHVFYQDPSLGCPYREMQIGQAATGPLHKVIKKPLSVLAVQGEMSSGSESIETN